MINMKTQATWRLPVYQLIGPIVRVHWDYELIEREGMEGIETYWEMTELVVPNDATPEEALALGVPPAIAAEFKPENFTPPENIDG
jgi:hypothetical protein